MILCEYLYNIPVNLYGLHVLNTFFPLFWGDTAVLEKWYGETRCFVGDFFFFKASNKFERICRTSSQHTPPPNGPSALGYTISPKVRFEVVHEYWAQQLVVKLPSTCGWNTQKIMSLPPAKKHKKSSDHHLKEWEESSLESQDLAEGCRVHLLCNFVRFELVKALRWPCVVGGPKPSINKQVNLRFSKLANTRTKIVSFSYKSTKWYQKTMF